MKKLFVIALVALSFVSYAQEFAPVDKSIMDISYYPIGAHRANLSKDADAKAKLMPRIRVTYSRPLRNGRTIFGDLVKYNEPWRMGANESTEVIFYTPVKIGDSVLSPGRYSLYCTPTESTWTLSVSPIIDGWGIYGFDFSKDVAKVSAPVKKASKTIEALSITMYEASAGVAHLKVGWENSVAEFPIEIL